VETSPFWLYQVLHEPVFLSLFRNLCRKVCPTVQDGRSPLLVPLIPPPSVLHSSHPESDPLCRGTDSPRAPSCPTTCVLGCALPCAPSKLSPPFRFRDPHFPPFYPSDIHLFNSVTHIPCDPHNN
jgi:hypothetical protein